MNRRNVINANTDLSQSSSLRRRGWFPAPFDPKARDLGPHNDSTEDGKEPLTQDSGGQKEPS